MCIPKRSHGSSWVIPCIHIGVCLLKSGEVVLLKTFMQAVQFKSILNFLFIIIELLININWTATSFVFSCYKITKLDKIGRRFCTSRPIVLIFIYKLNYLIISLNNFSDHLDNMADDDGDDVCLLGPFSKECGLTMLDLTNPAAWKILTIKIGLVDWRVDCETINSGSSIHGFHGNWGGKHHTTRVNCLYLFNACYIHPFQKSLVMIP